MYKAKSTLCGRALYKSVIIIIIIIIIIIKFILSDSNKLIYNKENLPEYMRNWRCRGWHCLGWRLNENTRGFKQMAQQCPGFVAKGSIDLSVW